MRLSPATSGMMLSHRWERVPGIGCGQGTGGVIFAIVEGRMEVTRVMRRREAYR
jgi:hypothetical protein